MRVVVTGANGFVGRHLCMGLERAGYDVIPCVRKGSEDGQGDACRILGHKDEFSDLLKEVDFVVHTAGVAHQSNKSPEELRKAFQEGNTELTIDLAKAVSDSEAKGMIHISSIAASGFTRYSEASGLSENDAIEPKGDYGLSKRNGEPAVEALRASGKLGVNIRPPLIYGSGTRGNWPKLLKLAGSKIPLPFAWIKNRRSFLGIGNLTDLVSAILLKGDQPQLSGTYHVADSDVVSLREVVSALRAAEGRNAGIIGFPGKIFEVGLKMIGKETMSDGLFADLILNTTKFRNAFSWEPSMGTLEGMALSMKEEASKA